MSESGPMIPGSARPDMTREQMRAWCSSGWGTLGAAIADAWCAFNDRYFGGELDPLPIACTATTPHGKALGRFHIGDGIRRSQGISLAFPSRGRVLLADRGVLLHEMIHQALHESGRDWKHASEDWCDEIMRLNRELGLPPIHAAPDRVQKRKNQDGTRSSVRVKAPCSDTGRESLTQPEIATWPHSVKSAWTPAVKKALGPLLSPLPNRLP